MSESAVVTSADFSPQAGWDGRPFEPFPEWMLEAFDAGDLKPVTPNHTDYAEWEVKTPSGIVLATVGDRISRSDDGVLSVEQGGKS